jgi:hypothetical protein
MHVKEGINGRGAMNHIQHRDRKCRVQKVEEGQLIAFGEGRSEHQSVALGCAERKRRLSSLADLDINSRSVVQCQAVRGLVTS